MNKNGAFVISLDFELFWGVWDVSSIQQYGENIIAVKKAIPAMLDAFDKYNIKATFATVGFLFAKNKKELLNSFPEKKPSYTLQHYNVYKKGLALLKTDETDDPYHFGYSLLQQIINSPNELATHTFSHYYCLENGQTKSEFDADIKAAVKIAAANNVSLHSIVFPRNQINEAYLDVLKENNISVYRGNPTKWIYKPRKFKSEHLLIRFCRMLDAYTAIFGYNTFAITKNNQLPVNIAGSRFLKPYNPSLKFLEKRKLHRILKEMTVAAKKGELYHLWWHPHNFGSHLTENLKMLEVILSHFKHLETNYGFKNYTMREASEL